MAVLPFMWVGWSAFGDLSNVRAEGRFSLLYPGSSDLSHWRFSKFHIVIQTHRRKIFGSSPFCSDLLAPHISTCKRFFGGTPSILVNLYFFVCPTLSFQIKIMYGYHMKFDKCKRISLLLPKRKEYKSEPILVSLRKPFEHM